MVEDKNCQMKIFRNELDYTPNNYDITFEVKDVPSNLELESGVNLEKRLNKLMPLSRRLHLNIGTSNLPRNNSLNVSTSLRLNGKEVHFI